MNRALLLILGLLAISAVTVFLICGGDDFEEFVPPATVSVGDAGAQWSEDESLRSADSFDADSTALQDPEFGDPDDPLRKQITVPGQALVLQVWDGKKGVPAAAATVFVFEEGASPQRDRSKPRDLFASHWSDIAAERGLRFETDEHGRVSLPAVKRRAVVSASLPGSYGFKRVGSRHRDVEAIVLRPDETLTVKVVDIQGHGVSAVPVGAVQHIPARESPKKWRKQLRELQTSMATVERFRRDNPKAAASAGRMLKKLRDRRQKIAARLKKSARSEVSVNSGVVKRKTSAELRARRRTDDNGLAVFRHFQIYRRAPESWWQPEEADQFEAVLMMPLLKPEGLRFSGKPVPAKTLELVLPPTGSIVLRTVDCDGRPFTHPVRAELRSTAGTVLSWSRIQGWKEQNETEIVFPFVGLGLEFSAHCRLDDDDFRWKAPVFSGPGREGERVDVDLVVAPDAGMLFGRLIDPAGEPLANARPTLLINSAVGRLEGEPLDLDKDGRFHLPYHVRKQHRGPFRLEVRFGKVVPVLGLAVPLSALPVGRVVDLGDLQLGELQPIAFGTVTDDLGVPLVGARVQLQRERNVGAEKLRLQFTDETYIEGRTDAEGTFELYGELEPGRYRCRVRVRDHFPFDSVDLRPGEPVDAVLLRRSRILGTVILPSWLKSRDVKVVLESSTDPKFRREEKIRDSRGRQHVFFDWVRPGAYRVAFKVADFPDPFLRIEGIRIVAGQRDAHPRLDEIDLAAYLYQFEITAVDAVGKPLKPSGPLVAKIMRPGGQSGFVGFAWRNRRARVISTVAQLEVWPIAPGYHAVPVVLGPGKSELVFRKIPPVVLQLTGLRALIGETSAWIRVRLTGDSGLPSGLETWDRRSGKMGGWFRKQRTKWSKLKPNDTARAAIMIAGRYTLTLFLGDKGKGDMVPVELGSVDLTPGEGQNVRPARVSISLNSKRVQAALVRLAQKRAAAGSGR